MSDTFRFPISQCGIPAANCPTLRQECASLSGSCVVCTLALGPLGHFLLIPLSSTSRTPTAPATPTCTAAATAPARPFSSATALVRTSVHQFGWCFFHLPTPSFYPRSYAVLLHDGKAPTERHGRFCEYGRFCDTLFLPPRFPVSTSCILFPRHRSTFARLVAVGRPAWKTLTAAAAMASALAVPAPASWITFAATAAFQ